MKEVVKSSPPTGSEDSGKELLDLPDGEANDFSLPCRDEFRSRPVPRHDNVTSQKVSLTQADGRRCCCWYIHLM